jgi:integrase
MPRHAYPYRTRPHETGYWYFKVQGSPYRTTGILIKYNARGEPSNKAEADRYALEQYERQKVLGAADRMTLGEFLEPYYDYDRCPHIQQILTDGGSYTRAWAQSVRNILHRLVLKHPISQKRVVDLIGADWERWKQDQVRDGTGKRTINVALTSVRAAIGNGITQGRILHDSTARVRAVKEATVPTGVFTQKQVRRILVDEPELWGYERKVVLEEPAEHFRRRARQAYVFAYLFGTTGERPTAILACNWSDLERDELTFRTTKTGKRRTIPLVPRAVELLEELRDDSIRIGAEDPIFCDDTGLRKTRWWYSERFAAMMKAAKYSYQDAGGHPIKPYSLKHTFITLLLDAGADEMLVREYVGHSHTGGLTRVLTPSQARYKGRQPDRLRALLPVIGQLYC